MFYGRATFTGFNSFILEKCMAVFKIDVLCISTFTKLLLYLLCLERVIIAWC